MMQKRDEHGCKTYRGTRTPVLFFPSSHLGPERGSFLGKHGGGPFGPDAGPSPICPLPGRVELGGVRALCWGLMYTRRSASHGPSGCTDSRWEVSRGCGARGGRGGHLLFKDYRVCIWGAEKVEAVNDYGLMIKILGMCLMPLNRTL